MPDEKPFKRILLKLSGDALRGEQDFGICEKFLATVCEQLVEVTSNGYELGIVVGGGNILRGAEASDRGMDRVTADSMGMLATMINALAIFNGINNAGGDAKVMNAVDVKGVGEIFNRDTASAYLKQNKIVIFAGGTGNPFFSTDTAAALRAAEIQADIIFKATKVDGVFSDDPLKNPDATMYNEISSDEVIQKNLKVMDTAAFSICRENRISLLIFNIFSKGNILKAAQGEKLGTIVVS